MNSSVPTRRKPPPRLLLSTMFGRSRVGILAVPANARGARSANPEPHSARGMTLSVSGTATRNNDRPRCESKATGQKIHVVTNATQQRQKTYGTPKRRRSRSNKRANTAWITLKPPKIRWARNRVVSCALTDDSARQENRLQEVVKGPHSSSGGNGLSKAALNQFIKRDRSEQDRRTRGEA